MAAPADDDEEASFKMSRTEEKFPVDHLPYL